MNNTGNTEATYIVSWKRATQWLNSQYYHMLWQQKCLHFYRTLTLWDKKVCSRQWPTQKNRILGGSWGAYALISSFVFYHLCQWIFMEFSESVQPCMQTLAVNNHGDDSVLPPGHSTEKEGDVYSLSTGDITFIFLSPAWGFLASTL